MGNWRSVVLRALLAGGCMAPSVAWGQTADADKGAIRATFREWVRVAERGDPDTYLSFITDDAVVMAPGQPEVVGKQAIAPWIRDFFTRYTFKFSDWSSREVEVAGDLAFHRYTGVATLTPRAGGASLRQDRKYLDVLRRGADGRWRASHHVFNLNR